MREGDFTTRRDVRRRGDVASDVPVVESERHGLDAVDLAVAVERRQLEELDLALAATATRHSVRQTVPPS